MGITESNIFYLSQICKNPDKSAGSPLVHGKLLVSTVVTPRKWRNLMNKYKYEDSPVAEVMQVSTDLDHGRFVVDATCRIIAFDPVAARFISKGNIWTIANQTLQAETDGNAAATPHAALSAKGTIFIGTSQSDAGDVRWLASSRKVDDLSFEIRIAESRPFDANRIADLGQLFGISRTEMLVVRAIVNGGNVDMISSKMGLSVNTVRTHIKRIHSKLGIHDTAGLVALCLSYSI
jgi:DNA-binding CsgD family transcriptional regulator